MNITKEEVQRVLDAMADNEPRCENFAKTQPWLVALNKYDDAITLLQSKLAEEDAMPVAYLWQHCETGRTRIVMPGDVITADATWFVVGPLFTHPAKQASDFDLRGRLAQLKCWHRLTGDEAKDLIEVVQRERQMK